MNRIRILRFVTFFVTFVTIRYVDKEDLPQEKRSEEKSLPQFTLARGYIYAHVYGNARWEGPFLRHGGALFRWPMQEQ